VLRDCHFIRVADAQHFDSDQLWRNHNCVPPIAG
jgi:SET domain-containing protein